MSSFYRLFRENIYSCLAAFLLILYFTRLTADSICGIFGIVWSDEGVYLLSAKNQSLFGQAHFFIKDLWKPELIAPLLHRVALATITADEPLLWVRAAVALHVVCGAALIGWLSAKAHQNRHNGIACFLWVLLNPILFFYSHIGLSEGLQFFLLALAIVALYYVYNAASLSQALIPSCISGILIASFVCAKISALPAGVALTIGYAAAVYFNNTILQSQKYRLSATFLIAAIAITCLYFGLIIGSDNLADWWRANVQMEVAVRAPQGIAGAFMNFFNANQDAAFYFSFMPIYALYLLALIFAADSKRGFLFILWIITVSAIILESFLGGEIRRNFFSLSLLSILFGFSAMDFFTYGVRRSLKKSPLTMIGAAIILLHVGGLALLLTRTLLYSNYTLAVFCLLFLVLLFLAFQTAEPWFTGNKQKAVIGAIILGSLAPMMFQAFLTPRTADAIAADIEAHVPADATIAGELAPWFMHRLKRRIIFTNCNMGAFAFIAANDVGTVAPFVDYFIGDPSTEHCMPFGYSANNRVSTYSIFAPMNQRKLWELNHSMGYLGLIMLYEK